jgi:hypothetical protein
MSVDFSRWDMRMRVGPYVRFDRPLLERLVDGCEKAGEVPAGAGEFFTVYNCLR